MEHNVITTPMLMIEHVFAGPLLLRLNLYSGKVRAFHRDHSISSHSEPALNQSLIRWHKDFWNLLVSNAEMESLGFFIFYFYPYQQL